MEVEGILLAKNDNDDIKLEERKPLSGNIFQGEEVQSNFIILNHLYTLYIIF
jgi:hypothetical protein